MIEFETKESPREAINRLCASVEHDGMIIPYGFKVSPRGFQIFSRNKQTFIRFYDDYEHFWYPKDVKERDEKGLKFSFDASKFIYDPNTHSLELIPNRGKYHHVFADQNSRWDRFLVKTNKKPPDR